VRIFLDANVLFSAAKSEGLIRRLLEALILDGHSMCADAYVIEEARRNLAAKEPNGLAAFTTLLRRIDIAPRQAHPSTLTAFSMLPDKDRPVIASAALMKCDALVTGDRTHFGRLYGQTIAGVAIHSPRSLAELLL
jgi:hypothetical protein